MTATFSNYALEAMGFRDLIEKGSIAASFMSVTVYEVRGITLPKTFAEALQARVAGANYRIALSKNVNLGCQCLIGDDFTESEPQWLKEVKATGPFALVAVGPTDFIECEAGRMMRMPDGSITTYDSFTSLRQTLKSLEDRVLPPVVATLTLALNKPERYVALRKLARASAGRTSDGTTVHDIRLDVRAELTASRSLEEPQAIDSLAATVERAPKLHQRAATYFALGTAEDDQLKKFLYFFLSLEVETHAVFGRINHAETLRSKVLRDGTSAPRPSTTALITRDVGKWDNLFDRFVWCATCVWTCLVDDDIKLFKELKSVRDSIAHGRASEPPVGFARQAELLAHKVLWVQGGSDA
jgi:hypothetical protein